MDNKRFLGAALLKFIAAFKAEGKEFEVFCIAPTFSDVKDFFTIWVKAVWLTEAGAGATDLLVDKEFETLPLEARVLINRFRIVRPHEDIDFSRMASLIPRVKDELFY